MDTKAKPLCVKRFALDFQNDTQKKEEHVKQITHKNMSKKEETL